MRSRLLLIDASVNFVLGVALLWFPRSLVLGIGIPAVEPAFYASVLGAVLVGIGLALVLELRSRRPSATGLGLGGAVAINLSAGIVLGVWLLAGDLILPLRGQVFLWTLAVLLVALSTGELIAQRHHDPTCAPSVTRASGEENP
jgi:hypothetical protein